MAIFSRNVKHYLISVEEGTDRCYISTFNDIDISTEFKNFVLTERPQTAIIVNGDLYMTKMIEKKDFDNITYEEIMELIGE